MIQGPEFLMILLVALVVLGPSRIPEVARKLGGWAAELRKAASELRAGLEAEVGDVGEIRRQFNEPVQDVRQAFRDVSDDVKRASGSANWVGEKPISGPTPADAMRDLEEIERNGGEPLTDSSTTVPKETKTNASTPTRSRVRPPRQRQTSTSDDTPSAPTDSSESEPIDSDEQEPPVAQTEQSSG